MPHFGAHSKYSTPMTVPLCMPLGASRVTPTHSPGANLVEPMKLTVPVLPCQVTFVPTANEDGAAAELVCGGDAVATAATAGAAGAAPCAVSWAAWAKTPHLGEHSK